MARVADSHRRPTAGICSVGSWRIGHRQAGCFEALEDKAHGHGALPDGRRDALDRTTADIAHAEDTRPARFEDKRHHVCLLTVVGRDVCAGEQEPVPVFGELPAKPPGTGIGPNEDEQPGDRESRCLLADVVAQAHALKLLLADEACNLRSGRDVDPRMTLDLVDQVARHRARERLSTDDDVNIGTRARQVQRSLPGRVATAHDDDGPPEQAFASICVAA